MTTQKNKIVVRYLPSQRKRDHYTETLSCDEPTPKEIFLYVGSDTRPITLEHLKKKSDEGYFNFIDESKSIKLKPSDFPTYRKTIMRKMTNATKHCILIVPHVRLSAEIDFLTRKFNAN